MLPFMQQAQVERELAAQVNALRPELVYTHGMGAAFGTYCPTVRVTELWYAVLDRFEPGALVVVRPKNLIEQWEDHPPAINWQRAQDQGLETVGAHADGWAIRRVR